MSPHGFEHIRDINTKAPLWYTSHLQRGRPLPLFGSNGTPGAASVGRGGGERGGSAGGGGERCGGGGGEQIWGNGVGDDKNIESVGASSTYQQASPNKILLLPGSRYFS